MARTGASADSWAEHASVALAQAGYRQGGARLAVIDLLDRQRCQMTASEIEAELQDGGRSVGRASVYRILDELEEVGVIARVELGRGQAGYEPVRPEHHHHHLVCTKCGKVQAFDDASLEKAIDGLSSESGFEVTGHEVVLRGLCPDCRKA